MVNIFRCPVGVLVANETLIRGRFIVPEVGAQDDSSVKVFCIVFEVFFVRFARVRDKVKVFV